MSCDHSRFALGPRPAPDLAKPVIQVPGVCLICGAEISVTCGLTDEPTPELFAQEDEPKGDTFTGAPEIKPAR